jgi:hypothetical protein
VRKDIATQRIIDEPHGSPQTVLLARMRAVIVAQDRLAQREQDAGYELRRRLSTWRR